MSGSSSLEEVFEKTLREYVEKRKPRAPKAGARKAKKSKNVVASQSLSPANVTPEVDQGVEPGSHSIPIATRREVFERDQERCTYISPDGVQCTEHLRLQVDHIVPVARGGSNQIENLRLLCHAHNQLSAEQWFGREYIAQRRSGVNSNGVTT